MDTPILYGPEEEFPIGGCKVLRQSDTDLATVIGAGVTLFEALEAYEELQKRRHPHPGHRSLQHQAGGCGHLAEAAHATQGSSPSKIIIPPGESERR